MAEANRNKASPLTLPPTAGTSNGDTVDSSTVAAHAASVPVEATTSSPTVNAAASATPIPPGATEDTTDLEKTSAEAPGNAAPKPNAKGSAADADAVRKKAKDILIGAAKSGTLKE